MSAFLKRSKILIILVAFAAHNIKDSAIFRLKCNEQHSGIPESKI